MNTRFAALLLGATVLTSSALSAPIGEGTWYADFDEAAKVAQEQGKDLLVDFTGSDWCGWCHKLDDEVFSHEAFYGPAQEKFVLVALDFPRGDEAKAKVPNPERNDELQKKYGVRGFPTVLLMTPDGQVFGQTGYAAGGPEKYMESLNEMLESGKAALTQTAEIVEAFEKAADDEARLAAWERAVGVLSPLEAGSPLGEPLVPIVSWGMEHDADNAQGVKMRSIECLLASGNANDEVITAAAEMDPKNEKGLLEKVCEAKMGMVSDDESARAFMTLLETVVGHGFQDKELGFGMTFQATRWAAGPLGDPELAKRLATAAKEIGSDDEEAIAFLDSVING